MIHKIDNNHILVHSVELPPHLLVFPPSHLNPDPDSFSHIFDIPRRSFRLIACEMGLRDIPFPTAFYYIYVSAL